jgi:hypothetical protein
MMVNSIFSRSATALALLVLLHGGSSQAHHSFAMFDRKSEVALTGTVQAFQLTNPHSYIQLVLDKDGVNWTIEAESANGLLRKNWKRNSLLVGEKITVHAHPLRSGAPGAQLLWIQKADGTILGNKVEAGAPDSTPPPS